MSGCRLSWSIREAR